MKNSSAAFNKNPDISKKMLIIEVSIVKQFYDPTDNTPAIIHLIKYFY